MNLLVRQRVDLVLTGHEQMYQHYGVEAHGEAALTQVGRTPAGSS
ncbi:MAG: hypothetical protein WCA82_08480 [Jiangellales bacterium]